MRLGRFFFHILLRNPKLICVGLLLSTLGAKAQSVHVLKENQGISIVGKKIMVLEDKSASLSIEELRKPKYQQKFVSSDNEIINLNVTRSVIWLKIRITTTEAKEWYLEAGTPT